MSGHGGRRGGGGHVEEPENSERWMVTYADMLTLLLVLFIVLYAISAVNVSKFNQLKSSLSSAFDGGTAPSVLPGGNGVVQGQPQTVGAVTVGPKTPSSGSAQTGPSAGAVAEANKFAAIEKQVNKSLAANGLAGSAQFTVNQKGLDVTVLTNLIVFAGNSPVLLPGGQKIINSIIPSLATVTNDIEVDGNTNQVVDPSVDGWALSSGRAANVVDYILAHSQVAPNRLTAVGHSEYNPAVSPSNPNAVNLNRRVDIIILSNYSAADKTGLYTPTTTSP
jgi:chemotaxis protein MotB